jgi:hypothetical protein
MHHSEIRKIAFVGDYLPRKCGIATFMHDMYRSVAAHSPEAESSRSTTAPRATTTRRKCGSRSTNRTWRATAARPTS